MKLKIKINLHAATVSQSVCQSGAARCIMASARPMQIGPNFGHLHNAKSPNEFAKHFNAFALSLFV